MCYECFCELRILFIFTIEQFSHIQVMHFVIKVEKGGKTSFLDYFGSQIYCISCYKNNCQHNTSNITKSQITRREDTVEFVAKREQN